MNTNDIHHNVRDEEFDSPYAFNAAVKGAQIVTLLTELVNGASEHDVAKGIAHQLGCSHRTLQAAAVRVMLNSLVKWAQDADVHEAMDARNEAAVKAVLKLAPSIKDSAIPFI